MITANRRAKATIARKLGFIEYNGDLKVHNSLLNVILHDAPGLRRKPEDA